jgi:hypothetical protein
MIREDVRQWLIETAREHRLVTYGELGEQFNIPAWRGPMGRILGDISTSEYNDRRPFLSAIVVRQDTQRPGSGFWNIPEIDRTRAWEDYRDEVWQHWINH